MRRARRCCGVTIAAESPEVATSDDGAELRRALEARFGTRPSQAEAEPENRTSEVDTDPATGDIPDPETLKRILLRRTHRRFTPEPIAPALLELVLACALSASSKSDHQTVSILVVSSPELRARIADRIPDMPWIASAPEFLLFCVDLHRCARISELRGHPFENDTLDGFLNASIDAALALQTFVLAAESQGLGCCPISAVRNHSDEIARELALPPRVYPIAGLCVGHPAREGFVSMRLPPDVVVHRDRYDTSQLDAAIDAYDRRRDARFSLPRERQKAPERFGEVRFYGWSEDVARQFAMPERPDLRDKLRRLGFELA